MILNWKSIKNYLLVLFALVNVFLIITTIQINNSEKLSDEDITSAVELLNKNNIIVDKSIIENTPSNKDTIHLTDIYYAQGYENLDIIKTDDNRVKFELNYKAENKKDTIENILATLKKNGFDTKNIKVNKTGDKYKLLYYVNDIQVFNNDMTLSVSNDKLLCEGIWYVYESKNTYTWQQTETTYATNALINLISLPDRDVSKTINVTGIANGYYSGKDNINKSLKILSASPCYRLTTDEGILYYSISDGKFIK